MGLEQGDTGIVDAGGQEAEVGPDGRLFVDSRLRGTISSANSSTAPLGSSGVFTGTSEDVTDFAIAYVNVFANQTSAGNGLSIQQSSNGTNWDLVTNFTIPANKGQSFSVELAAKFFRVVYTNGAVAQGAFRLQTVFKQVYGKPSNVRISDTIADDADAELVKSIITGKTPSGSFDSVVITTDGRLSISNPPPSPPSSTTAVSRIGNGGVGPSSTAETVYTITSGKTLTLQRLKGGGENSVGGGRVELAHRPTGAPASDVLLEVGYLSGSNFQFDLDNSFVGDGTAQIVLKRINQGGGNMLITGKWNGYEA